MSMSDLKATDFSRELQGISGSKRKALLNGISYRIKTGTSRDEIVDYIAREKEDYKPAQVLPTATSIDTAIREPRNNEISKAQVEAVIREMQSTETIELVSNSGVRIDRQPRSLPPLPIFKEAEHSWYDRAVSIKQQSLYVAARFAIYFVVIAISLQPIHDFFKSLSLFGFEWLNAGVAAVIAIAVDLIAMDLFSRSVAIFFQSDLENKQKKGFALLIPSLIIIAANILITRENLTEKSNFRANVKSEIAWERAIAKADKAKKAAEKDYAAARGKFLSVKWRGAANVEECESGKASCRGPFSSQAAEYQPAFLEAETLLSSAKSTLEKVESQKPVLKDSESSDATTKRVWVYGILWACILATYVYEPRREFVS